MGEEQQPAAPRPDELQFDKVEYESAAPATTCVGCGQPIRDVYYDVNGTPACTACREHLAQAFTGGSRAGRILRALVFGSIAAALGAAIYYGVALATNMEFGLISILIGLMVGKAVKKGSDARGGWFYQGLAIFLTYTAIVSTYVPLMIKVAREHRAKETAEVKGRQPAANVVKDAGAAKAEPKPPGPAEAVPQPSFFELLGKLLVGTVLLIGLIYAIPFLGGAQNIMGLIIIGVGLYEAWVLNRRVPLVITGPYQLGVANSDPPGKADHVEPGT